MKPPRDAAYLNWIRTLPCACCGARSEAAHTGPHGLGQKSSDYSAIPLCAEHHRTGRTSYHHGVQAFAKAWGIETAALVHRLQAAYRNQYPARRPPD